MVVFLLHLNAGKSGLERLLINLSKAPFWKGFTLRKAGHGGQQIILALEFVHWSIRCLLVAPLGIFEISGVTVKLISRGKKQRQDFFKNKLFSLSVG